MAAKKESHHDCCVHTGCAHRATPVMRACVSRPIVHQRKLTGAESRPSEMGLRRGLRGDCAGRGVPYVIAVSVACDCVS